MAQIPQEKLDTLIEDAEDNGLESAYAVFESELSKLNFEQLRAMLPLVHIDYGDNDRVDEDELRRVMDESTWTDFITGYKQVTGRDIGGLF